MRRRLGWRIAARLPQAIEASGSSTSSWAITPWLAVLPKGTRVYAVGGAGPENFGQWIAASADGFGIGSALYKPGMSAADIGARARHLVAAYDKAKSGEVTA